MEDHDYEQGAPTLFLAFLFLSASLFLIMLDLNSHALDQNQTCRCGVDHHLGESQVAPESEADFLASGPRDRSTKTRVQRSGGVDAGAWNPASSLNLVIQSSEG